LGGVSMRCIRAGPSGRKRNLNPTHKEQDNEYDQNDPDYADTAMTITVAVAAEAAAKSPEQEDHK
jgi:hypothetical protein